MEVEAGLGERASEGDRARKRGSFRGVGEDCCAVLLMDQVYFVECARR